MKLSHWKIRTKLAAMVIAFAAVLAMYAAISYNTRRQLQLDGPYVTRIVMNRQLMADVAPAPMDISSSYLIARQLATTERSSERDSLIARYRQLRQTYDASMDRWRAALKNDTHQQMKEAIFVRAQEPALRFFHVFEQKLLPAVAASNHARAMALLDGEMRIAYEAHQAGIAEAIRLTDAEDLDLKHETQSLVVSRGILQIALLICTFALFGVVIGPLISRSITRPLQSTVNALSQTSIELASTVEEHERTALGQSAAVSQTTTAMDELDASFNQTAAVVKSAADRVQQSVNVATQGIKTVLQMQEGMVELKDKVGVTVAGRILRLSEQTAQISTITNQVSDLASQTNMLALNAAVEAARAGEHGKGFAVIATEIRKLADVSRKSAERISVLVDDIEKATNAAVMATEESARTVDQAILRTQATVSAFTELRDASNSAADSAQQTLLSVPQQLTAVKQVLESMDALSAGSRETAAAIGQSRVGIETLRLAISQLQSAV